MKGVFWQLVEASSSGDVEQVLSATKDAYSRRAYGEKAWKAAAEYLVKKYGAEDAAKIMRHKAMRWAHDQAKKRDVAGIVASVKSTVSSWPVEDILAKSEAVEEAAGSNLKGKTARRFFSVSLHKIAIEVDATVNDQDDFIALIVDGENATEAVKRFKEVGVWKFCLDKDKQEKRAKDGTYPIVFEFDLSKIKLPKGEMSEAEDKDRQIGIAKTIGDQLGGIGRVKMMTGAKRFQVLPEHGGYLGGLDIQFPLPKHKGAVNYFRVMLAGDDTYTVEAGVDRGGSRKVTQQQDGVYVEDLVRLFEKWTGLYLQFGR